MIGLYYKRLIKLTFFTIVFAGMLTQGYAQDKKTPQIQQTSIWMEGFEADGKLDEWQQPLQAYNDDTHIAYSLANDETYLYLAVKSNRASKILEGGLVWEVIGGNKHPLTILFPYNISYDRRIPGVMQHPDRLYDIEDIKEMEVVGMKEVKRQRVPVLNAYGIQAGITKSLEESDIYLSGERYYWIELAIPLQYFDIMSEDGHIVKETLDYRIELRGVLDNGEMASRLVRPAYGTGFSQKLLNAIYEKEVDALRPTALKGTYRLATKPD